MTLEVPTAKDRIFIFDTTLRDGQQSPGAGMTYAENIEYAQKAADLGVDILEAGFPSASRLEFSIVADIAKSLAGMEGSPVICGLCQAREEQVLKTIEALSPAQPYGKARVHIYLPVDPRLIKASLGERANDKNKLIQDVTKCVGLAASAGMEVEFSPEGYSNQGMNFNFTTDLIRAAVAAGARVINCPDTKGIASSRQGDEYFVLKMKLHAQIIAREFPEEKIIWSTHNHNDLGLATVNSLNAVTDGPARQIECTINGVGERAGNASLEQVVMNIVVHHTDLYTGIVTQKLTAISDYISHNMMRRQQHGPVVHENSFGHTSGGHANAILEDADVYHAFSPSMVGREVKLFFGPSSGSNLSQSIIKNAGYICSDFEKVEICNYIKNSHQDRRKGITDEELIDTYKDYRKPIKVKTIAYSKTEKGATFIMEGGFFGRNKPDGTPKTKFKFHSDGADSAISPLITQNMDCFDLCNISRFSPHNIN